MKLPYVTPEDLRWANAFITKQRLNPTSAEQLFESLLVKLHIPYEVQTGFFLSDKLGNYSFYMLDFYIPDRLIAFEIDGGYHTKAKDAKKDTAFERSGITIYRIENEKVDSVKSKILSYYTFNMPCELNDICSKIGSIYIY